MNEGLKYIGARTFYGCNKLTVVTLPNTVVSVGDGAFWNCTALSKINLPASVLSLHYKTFTGCTALMGITYGGTSEQWNNLSKADDWA